MGMMETLFGGSESTATNNSGGMNFGNNQSFSNGMNMNFGTNNSGNMSENNSFNNSSSTGVSGSQGTSSSSSNQRVWGDQSPFLKDVYGAGQNAYNTASGQINEMTPEIQQQMQQAAQSGMGGFQNQLAGGNIAGLQGQVGQNNYLDAMKGQVADDANLLKQQTLGSLDARAAASGMSGSSGYRDQVNKSFDNINDNAQGQMAQLGYDSFNQGIQNQMNVANAMDNNVNQGVQNSALMQQNAMNQFNPAMVGQQAAQNYAQTIGGPTVLGSSSSSSQNSSFGNNSSNSVGGSSGTSNGFSNGMNMGFGMNQGMGFGNNYGSNVGSGASSTNTQNGIVPGLAAGKSAGF